MKLITLKFFAFHDSDKTTFACCRLRVTLITLREEWVLLENCWMNLSECVREWTGVILYVCACCRLSSHLFSIFCFQLQNVSPQLSQGFATVHFSSKMFWQSTRVSDYIKLKFILIHGNFLSAVKKTGRNEVKRFGLIAIQFTFKADLPIALTSFGLILRN